VPVPHHPIASIGQLQMLHAGKEDVRFQLDRASKKLARASPQDIGQGIVNFTGCR
jgi:hypothetical protein